MVLSLPNLKATTCPEVGDVLYRSDGFRRAGEISLPFRKDDCIDGIEAEVAENGLLPSSSGADFPSCARMT